MPKMYYKIKDGVGELIKCDPARNKMLELSVSPALSGKVRLGENTYALKDGEAIISCNALDDGTYTPLIYTKEGEAVLEAIKKNGFSVTPEPTSEATLRRLLLRVYALEEENEMLRREVASIKEKIERPLKF